MEFGPGQSADAKQRPVERLVDSQFRPMPKSHELRAELASQKEITAQLDATRHRLEAALLEAKERLKRMPTIDPAAELMRREMEKLDKSAPKEELSKIPLKPMHDSSQLRQWGAKQDGKP